MLTKQWSANTDCHTFHKTRTHHTRHTTKLSIQSLKLSFFFLSFTTLSSILIVVVLQKTLASVLVNAEPMWDSCDNITSVRHISTTGNYEAINCNYNSFVNVTIGATGSSRNSGIPIVLFMVGGKVARGLNIFGLTASQNPHHAPLHITVEKLNFYSGAAFQFIGLLPQNSFLSITNNTFIISRGTPEYSSLPSAPLYAAIAVEPYSAAENDTTLTLSNFSSIFIINNRATTSFPPLISGANFTLILLRYKTIIATNFSMMSLSRNIISSTIVTIQLHSLLWYGATNLSMVVSLYSVVRASENKIWATTAQSAFAVHFYSSGAISILVIGSESKLLLDQNAVEATSVSSDVSAVYFYHGTDMVIQARDMGSIELSFNRIANTASYGTAYTVSSFGRLAVFETVSSASLSLSRNLVKNVSCSRVNYRNLDTPIVVSAVHLHAAKMLLLTATATSSLIVSDNEIANSVVNSGSTFVIMFSTAHNYSNQIESASVVNISSNRLVGSYCQYNAGVVLFLSEDVSSITIKNGSSMLLQYNIIAFLVVISGIVSTMYWTSVYQQICIATEYSRISIENNVIQNVDMQRSTAVVVYWQSAYYSLQSIAITKNSLFSIVGTTFKNSIGTAVYAINFSPLAYLTISNSSTFIICRTQLSNITMLQVIMVYMAMVNNLTVENNSKFSVSNSDCTQKLNITAAAIILLDVANTVLTSASALIISNNSIVVDRVADLVALFYLATSRQGEEMTTTLLSIAPGCHMNITENNVTATKKQSAMGFLVSSLIKIDLGGTLAINRNAMTFHSYTAFLNFPEQISLSASKSNDSTMEVNDNIFFSEIVPPEGNSSCPAFAFNFADLLGAGDPTSFSVRGNVFIFRSSNVSSTTNCPSMIIGSAAGLLSMDISRNQIISTASSMLAAESLSFPPKSSFSLDGNQVAFESQFSGFVLCLVNQLIVGNTELNVIGNRVSLQEPAEELNGFWALNDIFKLVIAIGFYSRAVPAVANACGNHVAGERVLNPSKFMGPPALAGVTLECPASNTKTQPASPTNMESKSRIETKSPATESRDTQSSTATPHLTPTITTLRSLTSQRSTSISFKLEPAVTGIPAIPVVVSPETTATLSVAASALGGSAAAVDAQTVSLISLVACANQVTDVGVRSLSVVALSDTCDGVLLGNTIVVAVATLLTLVSVAVAHVMLTSRLRGVNPSAVNSSAASRLKSACALARAPQLLLSIGVYFLNSYALCGLQVARDRRSSDGLVAAGAMAFTVPVLLVVSYPIIAYLFGARRIYPVKYSWRPSLLAKIGSFVFQSWSLDETVSTDKLFGCVFGGFRRLQCGWTLLPHVSFISTLPMLLATKDSGTCKPLFVLSASLYFASAIGILIFWPRRVALSDLFHSITLLINGLIVTNATVLLYYPENESGSASTEALKHLGTAVTVVTVLRLSHSVVMIVFRVLVLRGHIEGVFIARTAEVECGDLSTNSDFGRFLQINTCEYSGKLWQLTKEGESDLVGIGDFFFGVAVLLGDASTGKIEQRPSSHLANQTQLSDDDLLDALLLGGDHLQEVHVEVTNITLSGDDFDDLTTLEMKPLTAETTAAQDEQPNYVHSHLFRNLKRGSPREADSDNEETDGLGGSLSFLLDEDAILRRKIARDCLKSQLGELLGSGSTFPVRKGKR